MLASLPTQATEATEVELNGGTLCSGVNVEAEVRFARQKPRLHVVCLTEGLGMSFVIG